MTGSPRELPTVSRLSRRGTSPDDVAVSPARTTSAATLSTVVAMMPAFLVGASGVFLRQDLAFDEAGLGMAIALFMAASAVASTAGGRLSERIGAGNALVLVCVGSAFVMLSIALVADSLVDLAFLLVLAGVWNSVAQPAGSLALARGVIHRPALMFGVKQSAGPMATLLAGASVPLVSLIFGWRATFTAGSVIAFAVAVFVPRRLAPPQARSSERLRAGDAATGPLVALAVATGVASAGAVALGSFLVESAVAAGIAAAAAGWLMVAGSAVGIGTRLAAGWLADRYQGWALYAVAGMLCAGAGGYGLLALGSPGQTIVGALVAYGCGWGWTGLLFYAIVRLNPNAPAAATGIVVMGGAGGSALGPLVFGYVAASASYRAAWMLASAVTVLAAALILLARTWLLRDRAQRLTTGGS